MSLGASPSRVAPSRKARASRIQAQLLKRLGERQRAALERLDAEGGRGGDGGGGEEGPGAGVGEEMGVDGGVGAVVGAGEGDERDVKRRIEDLLAQVRVE